MQGVWGVWGICRVVAPLALTSQPPLPRAAAHPTPPKPGKAVPTPPLKRPAAQKARSPKGPRPRAPPAPRLYRRRGAPVEVVPVRPRGKGPVVALLPEALALVAAHGDAGWRGIWGGGWGGRARGLVGGEPWHLSRLTATRALGQGRLRGGGVAGGARFGQRFGWAVCGSHNRLPTQKAPPKGAKEPAAHQAT